MREALTSSNPVVAPPAHGDKFESREYRRQHPSIVMVI